MTFDTSGLESLSASLGRGGPSVLRYGHKALEVNARKVKERAREYAAFNNPESASYYDETISYDFTSNLEVDIGPTTGGQGSLGGILEEGTGIRARGGGNAPQNNLRRAAKDNHQDLIDGATKAASDAIRDALR